jgi:hypothetical protein
MSLHLKTVPSRTSDPKQRSQPNKQNADKHDTRGDEEGYGKTIH